MAAREDQTWFTQPGFPAPIGDSASPDAVEAVRTVAYGTGTPWAPPGTRPDEGATRAERRRAREAAELSAAEGDTGRMEPVVDDRVEDLVPEPRRGRRRRDSEPAAAAIPDGFDPGDTGTWRVRDVVPGADGGRRTTTILRYLLGLLAVDHVRALTRWTFLVPIAGLILLVVHPRWIGLAVLVLGALMIVGRAVTTRMIARRTLPRRYRPVEDDLRAAVEAGKANLRGELRRVGMPSSALALPRSVFRLGSSDSRRTARSRLRDIEIDRVLPRAQLDRALRVLDGAPTGR
jgi:hypothetical protein